MSPIVRIPEPSSEPSDAQPLSNSTVSDVSRKERLGAEAVEGILNRRVAQAVDWASLKVLGVLGVDEIALKKGHRDFVTIVSAQPPGGELTILAVLGFINAAREVLPHARVVIDRFHVAKAYRACADQLREPRAQAAEGRAA